MDTAQWLQESGDQVDENKVAMEDHHHHHHDQMMGSNNGNACPSRSVLEKRARPQEQLNCPRCNSTNTKFCYYNNYSLTQPRYFCKTCRRYWTEGGTLRNVPVGGGSRKNKKPISSSSSSSSSTNNIINIPDLNPPTATLSHFSSSHHHHHHQNPRAPPHEAQDLNLAFNALEQANYHSTPHPMDLLRSSTAGIASRGVNNNNNSFIPTQMPPPDHHSNAIYSSSSSAGFSSLQEFKPTSLGFCVDGLRNSYGDDEHENSNVNGGGRILFPFGDLKQIPSSTNHHHHELDHQSKGQANNPTGYWNGLLGGGSW